TDKLEPGKFDSLAFEDTNLFLTSLKTYYTRKMQRAVEEKESMIAGMTDTEPKLEQYETLWSSYVNKAVSDAVRNISTPERIVEYQGTLIQKIYPIYILEHKPRHPLDYSASLYQP